MDKLRDDQYMFLLCSERSGSNFITKLMNNHSVVCGPSTKHIINPLARNYFRYQPLSTPSNWSNLISEVLNLYNVSFSIWKSQFTLDELLSNTKPGDLFGLLNYMFSKETESCNKSYCFVKEIKVFEFYPFLKHYFSKASFVHLVRDPRDMALSWKKSVSHKGGVIAAARQWKVDQQQYIKIIELEKLTNNVPSLKYEDLVRQPEEGLQSVLSLIDLDFESTMLNMQKDDLTKANAKKQETWKNLSKPIMANNFNKFELELSEQEIKYIEAICYFEMNYFGYQSKNEWSDLETISSKDINDFNVKELQSIEYCPDKSVAANMIAKKRFYQHLLK